MSDLKFNMCYRIRRDLVYSIIIFSKAGASKLKYNFHLIVIGGGSAGLTAASGAAGLGASVMLTEKENMGGDCLNYGCVPSKSFLRGAHLAKEFDSASEFGFSSHYTGDIPALMARVQRVVADIAPHDSEERYRALGVSVVKGKGTIEDSHTVSVSGKRYTAKSIIIATGSTALIPQIKGLEAVPYYTNRTIFDLKKTPHRLVVLGAGPIGLELGQGFRHLGAEVVIIDKGDALFKKDDPEAGRLMRDVFAKDGVELKLSAAIKEVSMNGEFISVTIEREGALETVSGDSLLVSLGRTPMTEGLNLDKNGIAADTKGYIITDAQMRTSVKNIYACGDITGPYQFTHMASYQAAVAIKNALFKMRAKVNYDAVPWCTYTKPEVAHVGHTESSAKSKNIFDKYILVSLSENDRARTENDTLGFLKLIISQKGKIIGATIVGDKAGEMIAPAVMAVSKGMGTEIFYDTILPYPTESEIYRTAALKNLQESVKPWQRKILDFLLK